MNIGLILMYSTVNQFDADINSLKEWFINVLVWDVVHGEKKRRNAKKRIFDIKDNNKDVKK